MSDYNFKLERLLVIDRGASSKRVTATIGGVRRVDDHTYACDFTFPEIQSLPGHIYGEDAVQAVQLCFRHFAVVIDGLKNDHTADVWWLTPGDRGGF